MQFDGFDAFDSWFTDLFRGAVGVKEPGVHTKANCDLLRAKKPDWDKALADKRVTQKDYDSYLATLARCASPPNALPTASQQVLAVTQVPVEIAGGGAKIAENVATAGVTQFSGVLPYAIGLFAFVYFAPAIFASWAKQTAEAR